MYRERTRKVALTIILTAIGVIISPLWFPVGPSKAFPGQHLINVLAGILVGPWWAALIAILIGIIRNALGIGTIFAFPGGIPGGVVVGIAYEMLKNKRHRTRIAALTEPIGTVLIGATLSIFIIAPLIGKEAMIAIYPMVYLGWAISSLSGVAIALAVLEALKRARIIQET
ncbi:energy coupling factor transporter S component ThiW [archaeon]|nr:MAG: energy coupling factor transporter S component ThiW [archaeon]RLG65010.1 MAG: energy coupling factor transporter S component ThiW [archaeon]RLG66611.1 MAG: energy coupling factor transporter S component ThiW [archaeon]